MSNNPAPGRGPGYEVRDANLRLVIGIGIGVLALTVAALLAMDGFFDVLESRAAAGQGEPTSLLAPAGGGSPPEPRLEADPRGNLAALRRHEDELLTTYGWADEQKTRVRIPVERAMELVAERGLPARQEVRP